MSEKKKVYCKDCFYLLLDAKEKNFCGHDDNMGYRDTWYERRQLYSPAHILNKNNDCPRFLDKKDAVIKSGGKV